MYSAKNPSCNKPNLITPTRLDYSFNYLWVGTIQIVLLYLLINKCVKSVFDYPKNSDTHLVSSFGPRLTLSYSRSSLLL